MSMSTCLCGIHVFSNQDLSEELDSQSLQVCSSVHKSLNDFQPELTRSICFVYSVR